MLGRLRRRRPRQPRLSVVVPVYNVEPYLAECLDSILGQTYDDLEVLLVDDGSTDGSVGIAQQYVRRHDHVRMIHQQNAGLSAARNTGVRHVSGELLAFADSDDTVPPDAYEAMVTTLDQSGSDFVVGSVLKGVPGDASVPPWLRPIHRERRIGIAIEEHPSVIHSVFAWNKIFRRSFWDDAGITFPEGLRYEDQVAITHAYLLAKRIDVLARPVYLWRVRTDGSSITQRRHELADLQDRVETKLMASEVVDRLASPTVREQWRYQGLPGDLPLYFHHLPECADDYWDRLHTGLRAMCDVTEIRRWRIPTQQRLTAWFVHEGRRVDASAVIAHLRQNPRGLDLDVRDDHVVVRLPHVDDVESGVPAELYRLGEHEMVFDARLLGARLEGTRLLVDGWALIRGVPPGDLPTSLQATWRRSDGVEVSAAVSAWSSPEIDSWLGLEHQRYERSGFTAVVDCLDLVRQGGGAAVASDLPWTLQLRRRVAQITREGTFRSRHSLAEETATLPADQVDGYLVEVGFDPRSGGLRVALSHRASSDAS